MPVVLNHLPRLDRVEIETVSFCNLGCRDCNRFCGVLPTTEKMELEDFRRFVDESLALGRRWNYVGLLGGEPTLHPQLFEILDLLLADWHRLRAGGKALLSVVSNMHGRAVERVAEIRRRYGARVFILESPKSSLDENSPYCNHDDPRIIMDYVNMRRAPVDCGVESPSTCATTSRCGLALTPRGWFACGMAAGLSRFFEMDLGIRHLKDATIPALNDQLRQVCGLCGCSGHGLNDERDFTRFCYQDDTTTASFMRYGDIWPKTGG